MGSRGSAKLSNVSNVSVAFVPAGKNCYTDDTDCDELYDDGIVNRIDGGIQRWISVYRSEWERGR